MIACDHFFSSKGLTVRKLVSNTVQRNLNVAVFKPVDNAVKMEDKTNYSLLIEIGISLFQNHFLLFS